MKVDRPLFADVPVPPGVMPYEIYASRGAFHMEDGAYSVSSLLGPEGHFGDSEAFDPEETEAILALAPGESWREGDWEPWFRLRRLDPATLAGWAFGQPFFGDGTAEQNGDFDEPGRRYEECRTGSAIGLLNAPRDAFAVTRVVGDGYFAAAGYSPEAAAVFGSLADGESWTSDNAEIRVRRIR